MSSETVVIEITTPDIVFDEVGDVLQVITGEPEQITVTDADAVSLVFDDGVSEQVIDSQDAATSVVDQGEDQVIVGGMAAIKEVYVDSGGGLPSITHTAVGFTEVEPGLADIMVNF